MYVYGILKLDIVVSRSKKHAKCILMVRQQLAFLRQTHGVDAMRLEHKDRDIGTDRDDHQGEEQIIPTRQLGNQENPGQRSVHHPGHNARHTQQSEILL